ncbi:helix-turn-helix transcriptional regulator [Tengunoibacter tsumagoiensis]|uniref:HTH cro/C1-type domain-containing protein n=1 Tax=Tengunoibacter tsumagoiensis TaxID=2014871 RepID=A0A402A849_9CHLR|nr:helix-turn-helix transcriptional regulator [Tengunoibacter tsumagoiensis]GCE15322.1 hypothetical protein KTT_51810 [Tengunoibacter tsumagoiensis]
MGQKQLNEKLINARLSKQWTQEEACEKLGVPSARTWQRWEREGVTPSLYFRKKLCEVFCLSLEDLGFEQPTSIGNISSTRERAHSNTSEKEPPPLLTPKNASLFKAQTTDEKLLQTIIERNFSRDLTEELLASNIKTMNFRDEWQYVVNNLVAEAKSELRAMVFDVELTRWWNTIAGQIYMMTNIGLLKKKIPIKRIFILSSLDMRLRMNTLITAYVHHKIGVNVRICKAANFQNNIPFKPDMFSVHDNLFVTLYYFSLEKPITNLLLETKHIAEFTSFYDDLFEDDQLCSDVESVVARSHYNESFFTTVKTELNMLYTLEKYGSVTELARRL